LEKKKEELLLLNSAAIPSTSLTFINNNNSIKKSLTTIPLHELDTNLPSLLLNENDLKTKKILQQMKSRNYDK
jgi:hypothetical protein